MVVALGIDGVLDILHVEGDNLQAHLGQVRAGVFHHADGHLLAVGQNLVDRHLADDLTQVALQHIVDLLVDVGFVHAQKVGDGGLLAAVDVLFDVIVPGVTDFLVRDGGVLAVDLHGDDAVQPEGDALFGFYASFRRFYVDFQQAHVQPVGTLYNGQYKHAAAAHHLGAGQAKARYHDGLGRRGFFVAEKREHDQCHHNGGDKNSNHH